MAAAAACVVPLVPPHISFPFDLSSPENPNKLTLFFPRLHRSTKSQPTLRCHRPLSFSCGLSLTPHSPAPEQPTSAVPQTLLRLAASAALFFGLGLCCWAASAQCPPLPLGDPGAVLEEEHTAQARDDGDEGKSGNLERSEDSKLEAAFGAWKSKTYALTVPLRIAALRGSVPPSWVKDFMQSQGKRSKVHLKSHASLEGIFSDLLMAFSKGKVGPSSIVAADLVSVGDSWLSYAINKALIEPIQGVEDQDWFKGLSDRWKVYLRRNSEGRIDPDGKVWAAPYRWGCMVIAYKKTKFRKHKLAPVEDWADLWRPELAGKISMVDSPREVIGAVLKYMGASYNTKDIHLQVDGGKDAVRQNLALLVKQAIPAVSQLETNRIGGRVRGPSPLIHQWIEFCLQTARALPFKQEVVPGASPSALDSAPPEVLNELIKGKPRLDTNLVAGVPPPQILARCEFLEPLSDSTLSDYQWLIASMQKNRDGLIASMHSYMSSLIQIFWLKLNSKPA
ncbi:uncharacterized protein LOC117617053 isoform X2 [Prunus dulcis]|uniref:uncharacterized protein LOC117617053 isoform X2 n=1 Tax=Prunus dulcis TaxID=3755 RepID=UPI001481E8DD|nr:uncharacterized protein LOC117617053 isoform X2 [Prunus dulcis]